VNDWVLVINPCTHPSPLLICYLFIPWACSHFGVGHSTHVSQNSHSFYHIFTCYSNPWHFIQGRQIS